MSRAKRIERYQEAVTELENMADIATVLIDLLLGAIDEIENCESNADIPDIVAETATEAEGDLADLTSAIKVVSRAIGKVR